MTGPAGAGSLPERPLLRGTVHLGAAVAAGAGAVLLLLLADSPRAYVSGSIFAASLVLLYATSAAYHSVSWPPRLLGVARRLDHAMIFTLIAGTYTPFCLIVLDAAWGTSMLSVVWALAAAGIVLKLLWPAAPRWLSVLLYTSLGWLGLVAATEVAAWFTALPLALLLVGAVMYTVGGIVYAAGKPDPYPRVFGYHEVFHLLVVAGSVLHFLLVAVYVLPA